MKDERWKWKLGQSCTYLRSAATSERERESTHDDDVPEYLSRYPVLMCDVAWSLGVILFF